MNSWLNQGRLRRPGRGLKSKRIRQQTIQKTASHTEFLTLPLSTIPVTTDPVDRQPDIRALRKKEAFRRTHAEWALVSCE